ncbi:hypothetical protein Slin15195_G024700 [Septoria linicola]|uniref:Uncharacterized protein n=1 Tax=Septoria linicola TaxID=215465 RepID=A0A9Q9AQW7_9PEZI|nr:hypothetical protein Slin14017_G023790 [Septoria linicola]USW49151.1 hypothetical protein Slin15195_G024700 [Septoria linicola]
MTQVLRSLYLLWLPFAVLCLVIPAEGQGNAHHIYARKALAREIASLKAEYGEAVDTSLNGYDHELVATTLKEARRKRSVAEVKDELAKEATVIKAQYGGDTNKIDLSLDGYDLGDVEDYDEEIDSDETEDDDSPTPKQKRSFPPVIVQEASAIKAEYRTNKIDLSLDGYDLDSPADGEDDDDTTVEDNDATLETRDTGSANADDILGHIYSRSTPLKNYEPVPNKAEFSNDVDFSLDGYDIEDLNADYDTVEDEDDDESSPLTRRSDDDDDEDDDKEPNTPAAAEESIISAPNKADFSPGVDFSLNGYDTEGLVRRDLEAEADVEAEAEAENDEQDETLDQYLTSWDDEVRKRDFPDDIDDVDDNDRYHDVGGEDEAESLAAEATAAAEAARENVRRAVETAEEGVEKWYGGVKRWLGGPEQ